MEFFDIINTFEKDHHFEKICLTDESQNQEIELLADELYSFSKSVKDLRNFEKETIKIKNNYSFLVHSAVKIALSKKILSELKHKFHFTIVFAVYKDHIRILTKDQHPDGENFLIRKIKQVENLTKKFSNISWDMVVVDDGCPENSGKIAENILEERYSGNNVKVLYLQNAIDRRLKIAEGLQSVNDSSKGGAIEYGIWYSADQRIHNHIIIYTDADLSIHLGQIGLLAEPVINEGKYAAIASRREISSSTIKNKVRSKKDKLFIYLWKRLIRRFNYITDMQCGFKAFRAEVVKKIIFNNFEKKNAFDVELLLKTDKLLRESIAIVPIAWINSKSETATENEQFYLDILKSITKMYFKYLPANSFSHSFAFFIKSLNQEQWEILVNHVPEGIIIKSAVHYDRYDEIKVPIFQKILEEYK